MHRTSPKRRWLGIGGALAGTLAAALVVGVGVTQANTRATVTIKLLAQSNGQGNPQIQAVIDNFQKANPNIKVETNYVPIGATYANTLRTQLQGGNGPDVFYVTPGGGGLASVMPLASAGYVLDLASRPWAKRVPVNARPLYFKGKKLYAVPIDVVPTGVMYQPNVLKDLGLKVPTTMSQLLANCKTAKSKGKSFVNLAGASAQNAGLFATVLAGSYVLAADPQWNLKRLANKTTFSGTTAWHKALQRVLDMKDAGCFPGGAEANDNVPATPGFVSGQVVSWALPSSITGLMRSINPKIELNFFAMPGDKAADARVYASPSDAFAVNSKTKQKAAAVKLVDFWAREGQSRLYAKLTGAVSLHQAATGQGIASELTGLVPLLKQPKRVFPLMQLEWTNPKVFDALGVGVQGLLTGQKTVDAVLKDADAAWSSGS